MQAEKRFEKPGTNIRVTFLVFRVTTMMLIMNVIHKSFDFEALLIRCTEGEKLITKATRRQPTLATGYRTTSPYCL